MILDYGYRSSEKYSGEIEAQELACYVQVRVFPIPSNQFLEQTAKLTATEFEFILWLGFSGNG